MMEPLNKEESLHLLSNHFIGHLAYIAKNTPFVVPITYYYNQKENIILSYSNEGHKIDAMRLHSSVSVQIEEIQSINQWKSLLLIGDFEELKGSEAKMYLHSFALNVKSVMAKKESIKPELINNFSSKLTTNSIPIVYRINIHQMIGRKNMPQL